MMACISRPKVWQPWLSSSSEHFEGRNNSSSNSNNPGVGKDVSSSSRWRRDRRPCPLTTTTNRPLLARNNSVDVADGNAPLDMSTRRRPTADHVISRPTRVISTCHSPPTTTTHAVTSSSSEDEALDSDPVIDEHFRRSLGRDYLSLFPTRSKSPSPPAAPALTSQPTSSSTSSNASLTGLSVDDHFAKALGETWLRLQAGEKSADSSKEKSSSSPAVTKDDSSVIPPLRVST